MDSANTCPKQSLLWQRVAVSAALFVASYYLTFAGQSAFHVASTRPVVPLLKSVNTLSPQAQYKQVSASHSSRGYATQRQVHQDDFVAQGSGDHFRLAASACSFCVFTVLAFMLKRNPSSISMMAASGARPTLADTKLKFLNLADTSIPNMYNIPIQELLAQHHLIRYSSSYQCDDVFALGIVSVINQLLEGLPQAENERIQTAYFGALGDDIAKFKQDALELEQWASSPEADFTLAGSGSVVDKLKAIAARVKSGEFQYTKFFSIGLFQLLQQSGKTGPEQFTTLVSAMNLDKEKVTKDLKVYKDLLKRLEMAKDMKEKFLERERKKQAERLEKKAQAQSTPKDEDKPKVEDKTKDEDKPKDENEEKSTV